MHGGRRINLWIHRRHGHGTGGGGCCGGGHLTEDNSRKLKANSEENLKLAAHNKKNCNEHSEKWQKARG